MSYRVSCFPERVDAKEIDALETGLRREAKAAIRDLARSGPAPPGRTVKKLGKQLGYLWQMNLKVNREQLRILYFPHGQNEIVLVSVFTKGSPQEQQRAYETAVRRKADAETILAEDPSGTSTIH